MALPSSKDTYSAYTDQLVYFSARLTGDPKAAQLATQVEAIISSVDKAEASLREARRAEVRARAIRDHRDDHGDRKVKQFSRRLNVAHDASFVVARLFPKTMTHTIAPRGRAQVERLRQLRQNVEELLASERLAAHPEADELRPVLEEGHAMLEGSIDELDKLVEAWEVEVLEVARARDVFDFRRADGVAQLGGVIGELRGLLGGSSAAAYGYTQPSRSRAAANNEASTDQPNETAE